MGIHNFRTGYRSGLKAARHGVFSLGKSYSQRVQDVSPGNLIAYWGMQETSGLAAINSEATGDGTYPRDVATMTTSAGPASGTAPLFDGANDYLDIYSASLSTAFDFDAYTIMAWVNRAAWGLTGGSEYIISLHDDTNNWLRILKPTTANKITFNMETGGTTLQIENVDVKTGGKWYQVVVTGSLSGDAMKAYISGVQVGSTQTGLVAFNGDGLTATNTTVGAANTSAATPFPGLIARVAIWDTPLANAKVMELAQP